MSPNEPIPEVAMPHCPHRNLLRGQKALVTGASPGTAKSVAIHLAQEGADVVVNYVGSAEPAEEVVATIASKGGKAIAIQADVSKEDQPQNAQPEQREPTTEQQHQTNKHGAEHQQSTPLQHLPGRQLSGAPVPPPVAGF